ncbi:tetratricopeptide repeat protein, partial [Thomasclavelia spiroformis]|uniref:tetratricopeptide repeat protein n=1 Tax=Thomasclavelia spiroformis TaxID=29348 RepID=UPI000B570D49
NAGYHDSLGTILHEMKRYEEALQVKRELVEKYPSNARYHDSLGTTLHEMKRYEEALKEAEKAVELEPEECKIS